MGLVSLPADKRRVGGLEKTDPPLTELPGPGMANGVNQKCVLKIDTCSRAGKPMREASRE